MVTRSALVVLGLVVSFEVAAQEAPAQPAASESPAITLAAPQMVLAAEPPSIEVGAAPSQAAPAPRPLNSLTASLASAAPADAVPVLPAPAMTLPSAPPAVAAPVVTPPAAPVVAAPVAPAVAAPVVASPAAPAVTPPVVAAAPAPPVPAHPLAEPLRTALDQRAKAARTKAQRDTAAAISAFYTKRADAPVWVADNGQFNAAAKSVLATLAAADEFGLDSKRLEAPQPLVASASPADQVKGELDLLDAAMTYASHARGGRMDPTDLSYDIDRRLPQVADEVLLANLAGVKPGAYLQGLHPKHPQFELLRQAWLEARAGTMPAGLAEAPTPAPAKGNAKAASAPRAPAPRTPASVADRLLVNMEMWRWMPEDMGSTHIFVNVPEFTFRVKDAGRTVHEERVITGKVETQTPIFSDEMDHIVINPFWGVPDSIKVKELLPGLLRGYAGSLAKQNLKMSLGGREVDPLSVDWRTTDIRRFHVFQPPGTANALGEVKFMFPNNHHVYMHDTPTKNLFNSTSRAFSHGCVRVRNPRRFAEVVLGLGKGWSAERTQAAFREAPGNHTVRLDRRIPVHIAYFTASVDGKGQSSMKNDIYGYERLVRMGLEGKAHLIVKKKDNLDELAQSRTAGATTRVAETQAPAATSGDRSWARSAFRLDN